MCCSGFKKGNANYRSSSSLSIYKIYIYILFACVLSPNDQIRLAVHVFNAFMSVAAQRWRESGQEQPCQDQWASVLPAESQQHGRWSSRYVSTSSTDCKKFFKKILFTLCPLFNLQCFFAGDADLMEKQKKQTSNPHIELREFVVGCFFCFSFHSYCLSAVYCPLSTLIFLIFFFFPSCRIFRRQCQVLLPNLLRCRVSQNAWGNHGVNGGGFHPLAVPLCQLAGSRREVRSGFLCNWR